MLATNNLRKGGVYVLPDGEELIATEDLRGGFLLYTPDVWETFHGIGPAEYDAVPGGTILTCAGRRTPWRVEDLADTGRTLDVCPVRAAEVINYTGDGAYFF